MYRWENPHHAKDYLSIARAISFLQSHQTEQPTLDAVANYVGISRFHFQRLFSRWAGVSPKNYLGVLTLNSAKSLLRRGVSTLDVSEEVGLSSTSRLHDLFIKHEGITPAQYRANGRDLVLQWGAVSTPFGEALLATTELGICSLKFIDNNLTELMTQLQNDWHLSKFEHSPKLIETLNRELLTRTQNNPQNVLLKGTPFQQSIWKALIDSPSLTHYSSLAEQAGCPKSYRAAANALGENPVPVLIPCHHVLRRHGTLGGYRYGIVRKHALLAWDIARAGAKITNPDTPSSTLNQL